MMQFYKIRHWAVGGRQFPWASGYNPLDAIEKMPFLDGIPETSRKNLLDFWKINPGPPGIEIDSGARKWSHLIGNGQSDPPFFVSEQVLNDLDAADIPYLRATEIPICKIEGTALKKILPPKYFILETVEGIEIAWDAMGIPTGVRDRPAPGTLQRPYPSLQLRRSSWRGIDLMCYANSIVPRTMVYICTERLKQIAEQQDWTNVSFESLKTVP